MPEARIFSLVPKYTRPVANLSAAHQTLVEPWGYTVELIDDDASQGEFDVAAANNDVAYATNDINASRLGTKLVNATIGVVMSEDNLSDEFGMASSIDWESGTVVKIGDNTHYITSPFAIGSLTVFSASESLAYVTGTLFPDLSQFATSGSGYGIVTLDAGASKYGGGRAAGRRVQLPWGGSPSLEPNDLTADGLTILQRALEWGAGAGAGNATGLIAHWKLDDGAGVTAVDALSLTDEMTFTAWIRAGSFGSKYQTVLSKDSGGASSNYWFGTRRDEFGFGFYANGFFRSVFTTGVDLQTGTWNHLAASFDNASNQVELYLNGIAIHSGTINKAPTAVTADIAIGSSPDGEYWNGVLDEVRIYDHVLGSSEIADLGSGSGGGDSPYVELNEEWTASTANVWQTVDLSSYGVPSNAVVEVAITTSSTSAEREVGVRAVGSALGRTFDLHEAESGGVDALVLHVQTDGSSQIQHFTDNTGTVAFRLPSYWTGATYVEFQGFFTASARPTVFHATG